MDRSNNPFTIRFGGDSRLFFGREEQLKGFDRALLVSGSDYRATFITGARGTGKTSLLEQYSKKAGEAGWDVIDMQSEEALKALYRRLAPYDMVKKTAKAAPTVNTPLGGGSLGEKGSEKSLDMGRTDIASLFVGYCKDHPAGVCVTIDEIQKIPLDELSLICGAFQLASRKNCNVILAVAGLPQSYKAITQYEGCTYMRRANHIQLGLFCREEVEDAYRQAFSLVKGLKVDDDAFAMLVNRTKGQPYMVQLLGYFAVDFAATKASTARKSGYMLSAYDVDRVFDVALDTYEQRVLRPLVAEMSNKALEFARAMAATMDEGHKASIGAIAEKIGKATTDISMTRKALLDEELIDSPERGYVRFAIPYLREYLLKDEESSDCSKRLDEWDV